MRVVLGLQVRGPQRYGIGVRIAATLVAIALALAPGGCRHRSGVGDHVYVEWEGQEYPAMIVAIEGPSKLKIHYDGYDTIWDEVVSKDRVRRPVDGPVISPEPPAKVRAKAMLAAQTNVYKVGDHLRIEFHGHIYPATVIGIVGQERYRVHYDGYGSEWDETIGRERIQQKQ